MFKYWKWQGAINKLVICKQMKFEIRNKERGKYPPLFTDTEVNSY